jgi:hypothetical protein
VKAQKRTDGSVKVVSQANYDSFDQMNGTHSFKAAVPDGYVDYQVRTRPGGSVFYFNFPLAREMGLLAADHPDVLTPGLKQKILETFAIVIINEYDIENATPIRPQDVRPNRYMATRYLQLQHPNKQGKTSGDGRGIWNGEWKSKGTTWDVSSSGTGATRLSPAHAQTQKFFKTGDKAVGYGNGYNCVSDGLSAALMSEIFHENKIETERTLAIISFEGGSSINVRAGKNLFRPAHFFCHLKQSNYESLKASVDYFMDRQLKNGDWSNVPVTKKARYTFLAEQMALTFSKIAAQYEAEYVFCWLDWDGDNILANGGIIDYGSVRQFGLYHHEYRYDDVDRMSTNIPEQRIKARYIAQNFAQIADYLITGEKKNLHGFRNHEILKVFDRNFKKVLNEFLLKKQGFSQKQTEFLMTEHPKLVQKFKQAHSYFEKAKSVRGIYEIPDGVSCDAIFCMKDLHRELPKRLMQQEGEIKAEEFIAILKSSYAKPNDLQLNSYRRQQIARYQTLYRQLLKQVSKKYHAENLKKTLLEVTMRASAVNPENRITGDGALHVSSSLIRNQKTLSFQERIRVMDHLVKYQVDQSPPEVNADTKAGRIVLRNVKAIRYYRDSF